MSSGSIPPPDNNTDKNPLKVNDLLDSDCPKENEDDDMRRNRPFWEYILAGIAVAIFTIILLWIADRTNNLWAGVVSAIPLTLIASAIFIKREPLKEITFAVSIGRAIYMLTSFVFLVLLLATSWSKLAILGIVLVFWVIITFALFYPLRNFFT